MFVLENGRKDFYQWDTGQRLIINDDTILEAHFCNRTDKCSLVCEAYTEGGKRFVNVPNILLTTDWDIKVYAYCGNYTKVEERFNVIKRTKPADYVYTETEVKNWEALENRVNTTLEEIEVLADELEAAEDTRTAAEANRAEAETKRNTEENSRKEAEAERAAETATAINNANAAAKIAQEAAITLLNNAHADAIEAEESGDLITINDAAAKPFISLISHIEPQQAGSGEPSPDNIRAIAGYDTLTATVAGRNLLEHNSEKVVALTLKNSSGVEISRKGYIVELPAGDYVLKGEYKEGYTSGAYINGLIINENLQHTGATVLVPFSGATVRTLKFKLNAGEKLAIYNGSTEANLTLTKTKFETLELYIFVDDGNIESEQYKGKTITAALPETIYGGVLDWNTGVLTVDRARVIFDGTEDFTAEIDKNVNTQVFTCNVLKVNKKEEFKTGINRIISNMFVPLRSFQQSYAYLKANTFYWAVNTGYWRFGWGNVGATVDEFKTFLQENPLQIIVPLKPQTIQLTPQQLETLKGLNNIWSNSGSTEAVYIADTKLYIDNKLEALTNAIVSLGGNV